ncbi:MAG: NERD domain-containing protein [Clostridia bacterium]|nr:NERD domain-containing protein [Clostridia bacterium]
MGILDIFDKFRDAIILKEDCELERKVKYLEELKNKNPNNKNITQQLYMAQKGLEGENEIIYQLKKSNIGMFILHDVNLVYEDLKAQIDFIVITPWCCYFIECKNLIGNISVNEKGDFIREYSFKGHKVKKGMESPYRQVQAQRDVYKKIWLKLQGKLKGFLFERNFESFHRVLVVATNGENILNTKYAPKEMKNNIIKADALIRKLEYDRDHSDRDLWDNKKSMEQWANHFIKLNVEKEENFENVFEDCEDKVESSNTDILKERLIEFRKQRSKEKNIPAYYVFNNDELERILEILPKTYEDLKKSKILTDVKINSHGKDIVNIINQVQ